MAYRQSTGLINKLLGITITKITNGAFTTDTTGWTAVDSSLTSVAGGQAGNCLSVAESGGANPGKAYQDITTKVGHTYVLTAYVKNGTAAAAKITIGTTADDDVIYDSGNITAADWTLHTIYFVATATTTRIVLVSVDATAAETSLFDTVACSNIARSVQALFYKGFITFYTGSQPATPDAAPTGTPLVTFYSDGAAVGLTFADASSRVLTKTAAETWSGTAVASGDAGWFRLYAAGDPGGSSTEYERIDGAISTAGAELNMSSVTIVNGVVVSISSFQITMPQV